MTGPVIRGRAGRTPLPPAPTQRETGNRKVSFGPISPANHPVSGSPLSEFGHLLPLPTCPLASVSPRGSAAFCSTEPLSLRASSFAPCPRVTLPACPLALALARRYRHPIQRHEVEFLVLVIDVVIGRQPLGVVSVADFDAFRHADRQAAEDRRVGFLQLNDLTT